MITTRFYAAVPLARSDSGRIVLDYEQAIKCETAEQAVRAAAHLARMPRPSHSPVVVAFEMLGDPETGEWADQEVLARRGDFYWRPRRSSLDRLRRRMYPLI
jgi:hypothetical protein